MRFSDFRSAGAEVLTPIGGGVGLVLYALDRAVSADIVSWHTALLCGLLAGLWGGYVNVKRQAEAKEAELIALRHSAPAIKFQKFEKSAVRLVPKNGIQRVMEIWQLWFINDPVVRGSDAVARHLTAIMEFSPGSVRSVEPFQGQWAITQKPDHVGWGYPKETTPNTNIKNEIDLGLKPLRGKLMLLGQDDATTPIGPETDHQGVMRDVFALSGENIHAKPHSFKHSKYRLDPWVKRATVRLSAENMTEQEFHFALERDEEGRVLSIKEIRL